MANASGILVASYYDLCEHFEGMYIQVLRLFFGNAAARIFPLFRSSFIAETDDSHLAHSKNFHSRLLKALQAPYEIYEKSCSLF